MQVIYKEFTITQALSRIRGVKIEEGKENVWGEKIRRNEWEEEEDKKRGSQASCILYSIRDKIDTNK